MQCLDGESQDGSEVGHRCSSFVLDYIYLAAHTSALETIPYVLVQ